MRQSERYGVHDLLDCIGYIMPYATTLIPRNGIMSSERSVPASSAVDRRNAAAEEPMVRRLRAGGNEIRTAGPTYQMAVLSRQHDPRLGPSSYVRIGRLGHEGDRWFKSHCSTGESHEPEYSGRSFDLSSRTRWAAHPRGSSRGACSAAPPSPARLSCNKAAGR